MKEGPGEVNDRTVMLWEGSGNDKGSGGES